MKAWVFVLLIGVLGLADVAWAQNRKCTVYVGGGLTPLMYTLITEGKVGYCLSENVKAEAAFVRITDSISDPVDLRFYSLGVRYQVWGGWYVFLGGAYTSGTLENKDGKVQGKRTSNSVDASFGYEFLWSRLPLFLNVDIVKFYAPLSHTIEYRAREGTLPVDVDKYDPDLSVNMAPLIVTFGVYL